MTNGDQESMDIGVVTQDHDVFTFAFPENTSFDHEVAPQVLAQMRDVLGNVACKQMIVDLRAVSYLDSTALGVLVNIHTEATDFDSPPGKTLTIDARDVKRIQKLFLITGLSGVFDFVPEEDGAND